MTARWVVDEVAPNRELTVNWQPISLLFKNEPPEDSDYYGPVAFTHKMLRVMESVRETDGNDGVFSLYWELGRRIHHDRNRDFSAEDALEAAGLDEIDATLRDLGSGDSQHTKVLVRPS